MYYRNVAVELARNGWNKQTLTEKLNDAGVNIKYTTLCGKLRGEITITFGESCEMGKILNADPRYLLDRTGKIERKPYYEDGQE